MDEKKLIEKIKKALTSQPIRLAYLYGSFAKEQTHAKSDVDIAVVLEPNTDKADYKIAGEIHHDIGGGLPEIDVREISLDTEPVFLANALNPAKPILVKNEKERIEFEKRAFKKFYDTQYLRDINYHYLSKAIKEDRYGRGIPNYRKIA